MNRKNGLICILIAAMLSLCVINITAASTSMPTTVIHNGYNTHATAPQPHLVVFFLNNDRERISTAKVNETVIFCGSLWSDTTSTPNYIEAAKINIQLMKNGTWTTGYTTKTSTGEHAGIFAVQLKSTCADILSFRATYDGDSQYSPAVSNVAMLTVS
jgi:hypothetical protein